jgi:hypothetical protein
MNSIKMNFMDQTDDTFSIDSEEGENFSRDLLRIRKAIIKN